jgi:hypothetical protein
MIAIQVRTDVRIDTLIRVVTRIKNSIAMGMVTNLDECCAELDKCLAEMRETAKQHP